VSSWQDLKAFQFGHEGTRARRITKKDEVTRRVGQKYFQVSLENEIRIDKEFGGDYNTYAHPIITNEEDAYGRNKLSGSR
jgi:hypothetical protein